MVAPGRIEQRDRLRREPLPHDTIVVLRGGPDTVAKLVRHASSFDGLLASRMHSYRVVHRLPAGKLLAAGFELLPTGGRPHYTIRMLSGDEAEALRRIGTMSPTPGEPGPPPATTRHDWR